MKKNGEKEIDLLDDSKENEVAIEVLLNTMAKDPTKNHDEAVKLLYRHLRTGQAPNLDIAQKFVEKLFFSTKKYDLGAVGRYRINKKKEERKRICYNHTSFD